MKSITKAKIGRIAETGVDQRLVTEINAEHKACLAAVGGVVDHALRCGELLVEAKSCCRHGQWSNWLAANFVGSDTTARAYMRIARHRVEIEIMRRSTSDLTLGRVLETIAPQDRKRPNADPVGARDRKHAEEQQHENDLAEAVIRFDHIAQTAKSTGLEVDEVFRMEYEFEPDGETTLQQAFQTHQQEIEEWRTAPWFPAAADRLKAEGIRKAIEAVEQLTSALEFLEMLDDVTAEIDCIRSQIRLCEHSLKESAQTSSSSSPHSFGRSTLSASGPHVPVANAALRPASQMAEITGRR